MEKEYYKELIIKELSEGLKNEQKLDLEEWLKLDPANKEIQTRLAKAWKHSELYKSDVEVDMVGDWKKVSSRLSKEGNNNLRLAHKNLWWRKPLSVAAAVLLLLSLGWFMFQNTSPKVLQFW